MFIITSRYLKSFEMDDPTLREHLEFVNKHYDDGTFVAFGSRKPRVGGLIIARGTDGDEMRALMKDDPFVREGIAEYEFQECQLSKATHPDLVEP
ncbi:YciI family protein [Dietzia cinnamea]|uniref:YciI family protein n=1 Tax=Dietzia TaxID=37914 RepID=UPI00313798AE